jgi:uncharacterized membrane protein
LIALATGAESSPGSPKPEGPSLLLDRPLAELPIVDNYRWNRTASERPILAVFGWWLVLTLVGWAVWPLAFFLFRPLRDRGYLLSRTLGWLLAGWLLWWMASNQWAINSVMNSWLALGVVAILGVATAIWQWRELRLFVRQRWPLLVSGEALFAVAYLFFIMVRLRNPDLWQPWFGGEKFMEFAFLNGILRSPYFPPVDPHFAGGYINYYYFGLYLVGYLIKLTGISAEVAFNLAIPTLFALTVVNAFAVAYSALGGGRVQERGREDVEGQGGEAAEESGRLESWGEPAPPPARQPAPDWRAGLGAALLAPLFVALIGNLDGFAQLVRNLAEASAGKFSSAFGVVQTAGLAVNGFTEVVAGRQVMPAYDFWAPSRVLPGTINEFPYWSFLYADLHAHVIGIPLALLFLALLYTLIAEYATDWRQQWPRALALLVFFGLMLGALASINLWELPTYLGLGALALLVCQVRRDGRIHWLPTLGATLAYLGLAYLFFLPFFQHYAGVGASGVGWVKEGDTLGAWLLIWGLFVFVLFSWLLYAASRPLHRDFVWHNAPYARRSFGWPNAAPLGIAYSPGGLSALMEDAASPLAGEQPSDVALGASPRRIPPLGGERWLSQVLRFFDRLPRLLYLQKRLVHEPTLGYLMAPTLVVFTLLAAALAWFGGRTVLAFCLAPLGVAVVLLWRRSREADPATLLVTLLTATGLAILAGTQLIYLKDFLSGGDYFRMNTVFKFFSQVWVLWGVAAAIGVVQIWQGWVSAPRRTAPSRWSGRIWTVLLFVLVVCSLAYPLFGTPARLDMRLVGWRPPVGTLNGLDYMREGSYTWRGRDANGQELPETRFELRYDWSAIQWLLDHVRGNVVLVESAERDYYRAGGTRAASFTGLSGLAGMHEGEQRYGEQLGPRDALYREFWNTPDIARTQQIIDELDIALVYVGQLEQYQHPAAVQKLAQMAAQGALTPLFINERTTIYAVPGRLVQTADNTYIPAP